MNGMFDARGMPGQMALTVIAATEYRCTIFRIMPMMESEAESASVHGRLPISLMRFC